MKKSNDRNERIQKINERINYLQKMIHSALYPYQKFYYNKLLEFEKNRLSQITNNANENTYRQDDPSQREFTLEELAQCDGSHGRPAYVCVNELVYDVSTERTWGGGTHFKLYAGKDLTNEFLGCHGHEEHLRNLPIVGVLIKE